MAESRYNVRWHYIDLIKGIMIWLKQLFSRRRLYDDLSEEIREHLAECIPWTSPLSLLQASLDWRGLFFETRRRRG
jgi:hypothetical protein